MTEQSEHSTEPNTNTKEKYKAKYDKIRRKLKENPNDSSYRDDLLASVYSSVAISTIDNYMEHYNEFTVTNNTNFRAMVTGKVKKI